MENSFHPHPLTNPKNRPSMYIIAKSFLEGSFKRLFGKFTGKKTWCFCGIKTIFLHCAVRFSDLESWVNEPKPKKLTFNQQQSKQGHPSPLLALTHWHNKLTENYEPITPTLAPSPNLAQKSTSRLGKAKASTIHCQRLEIEIIQRQKKGLEVKRGALGKSL